MTSFQALYGYEPPKWKEFALINTKVQAVRNKLEEEQKIIQILKENLATSRNWMKQLADKHRSESEFEEGDWVFVRLQPYKHLSLKQQGKKKLAPKFYGHFQINKKISQVAYRLELLDSCHIHNVFHISCLKKMLGQAQPVQTKILEFDDEGNFFWEPEGILDTKEKVLHFRTIKEYLIKWKDFPEEDSSWDSERFLL
jgi:hypothetical protein